jgi:hypothetical protein
MDHASLGFFAPRPALRPSFRARRGPLALDSWKQGPAISRSSRAQLCLARSVICLLLPPHSETYERLFDNCRLYNQGVPVACMEEQASPVLKPLHHLMPLFNRNCPARVVDAKRSRWLLAGKQLGGGAEPSLLDLHHSQGYRWRTPVRSRIHANRHPLHRAKRAD